MFTYLKSFIMPTVLLLDVSLSMSCPVGTQDSTEVISRRHLAVSGINAFLDYLSANCKLEFVSLVIFSSLYEQVVPFTRDYNEIRAALEKLDDYNKTCVEVALAGVGVLIMEEWGVSAQCQVLLITDGCIGFGEGSLKHTLRRFAERNHLNIDEKFCLPFQFPCKLHVLILSDQTEKLLSKSEELYKELISINGQGGDVFFPDSPFSVRTVQHMFIVLCEKYFAPFVGFLKCGNLTCSVQVFPQLESYDKLHEFERVNRTPSKEISICGFLDIADAASPPFISRHLVLPIGTNKPPDLTTKTDSVKDESEDKESSDQSAAFTVLLHGSLKVESMVALCQIGEDWFGMMYSFADNKKKSNLMLSIFQPGSNVVSWLGDFNNLGPLSNFDPSSNGSDNETKSSFPVCPTERRSYSQNCVVWIKNTGLQTDIQKLLRNARKLPEKLPHFYKELNRLRRAALSLGFYELLETVAQLLDRECTLLASNTHPDAALQMTHAASFLRSDAARDALQSIIPLQTNFATEWIDRTDINV